MCVSTWSSLLLIDLKIIKYGKKTFNMYFWGNIHLFGRSWTELLVMCVMPGHVMSTFCMQLQALIVFKTHMHNTYVVISRVDTLSNIAFLTPQKLAVHICPQLFP